MGVLYVLIWSSDDGDKRFLLRSDRYFVGRPCSKDLAGLGERFTGLDVLVFNPDDYSECVFTGFRSLVVSRRHALFYKRRNGDRAELVVRDYGPMGSGSRNGTIVNNELLPKGGEAVLREGDSVKLSSIGPLFFIGVQRGEKTVLSLEAGVPREVTSEIARRLDSAGVVIERVSVGDRPYVVIEGSGPIDLGNGLVINIKKITEFYRKIIILKDLKMHLLTVKQYFREGREEEAIKQLYALGGMDHYWNVLKEAGGTRIINLLHNDVIKLIEHNAYSESILNKIDICIKMLDDILEYIQGTGLYS